MDTKNFSLDRDTVKHLRLPFSFFLLPVFCLALSQANSINWFNTIFVFIILHFFIYPGSNIYNSYMDKDKGSIGALKNPPPVTVKLYYTSIVFDAVGLALCLFINFKFLLLMLIYVGISKAYSWKKIRLKKYGFTGWLVVMIFQGGYTFLFINMAAESLFDANWFNEKNIECFLFASLLIGASYPLTQIYQHVEDSERGDMTISYKLGVKGSFIFTSVLFLISFIFSFHYFKLYYNIHHFEIFALCLIPVVSYFFYWMRKTWLNNKFADYDHAMIMTFVSSFCMIVCFCILFFLNH